MKVKYKALIMAGSNVLFLVFATYLIFYFTYFGYINKQEEQQIERDFQVIDFVFANEFQNMKSTLDDWAHWDDTYQFVKDSNTDYIESNLVDSTLTTLDLKMMIFLDNKGNIVYNKNLDLDAETLRKLTNTAIEQSNYYNKEGLLLVNGKAYMMAASPVTDSNLELPGIGSLVFVREIGESMKAYVRNVANVYLDFSEYNNDDQVLKHAAGVNGHIGKLEASKVVRDIEGNPSIVFSIEKEHADHSTVVYFFDRFLLFFIFVIGFVMVCDILIANKYVLNRLTLLTKFMNKVAGTKDTTLSIQISGNDEFFDMADTTNKMLSELNTAYADMKEMDNRFRLIMEATSDGYLDFYAKSKEIYISSEWKRLIGYIGENGQELFQDYLSKMHPDCVQRLMDTYWDVVNGDVQYFSVEYRVISASGETLWVQQRGKVVERDEDGKTIRVVSTLANITERKKHEEEILFLSYSDKLTGLNNRAYMEKQFSDLDNEGGSRYFIIMGDLNGLKIVNDSMGHKAGDRLLCAVGRILKGAAADDDIVSRWGGDEFVILVKGKSQTYITSLIDKIRYECEKITDFHFSISIALGYAEKGQDNTDSEQVMSLAEDRMYRNKLMEDKSSRSSTISSLLKTLHEKHSETEEHTMRIKNLSLSLGKRLGLPQDKLDELELLALLHDIGKIGIPEHILMKPSKLTDEEWQIMKTHSEIGYRIAKSTPELSHIAYEILTHHEKYDGTGYPKGLKGESIPILSRIINVIDSYDVMTHRRVYKDALFADYAIEELKRCSGKQFDPHIVEEFLKLIGEDTEKSA